MFQKLATSHEAPPIQGNLKASLKGADPCQCLNIRVEIAFKNLQ